MIAQEDLDAWARHAFLTGCSLRRVGDALRQAKAPPDVQAEAATALEHNATVLRQLREAGATDPYRAIAPERAAAMEALLEQCREQERHKRED